MLHNNADALEASTSARVSDRVLLGGIANEDEARELEELNAWVESQGYSKGEIAWDLVDDKTGEQKAVLDLVWPNGLQTELSEPVAVLLGEGPDLLALANEAGFRCFTSADSAKAYVLRLENADHATAAE